MFTLSVAIMGFEKIGVWFLIINSNFQKNTKYNSNFLISRTASGQRMSANLFHNLQQVWYHHTSVNKYSTSYTLLSVSLFRSQ